MIEGWLQNDYLILFESQLEERQMTEAYAISDFIPEHTIVGLKGWDDFIVRNTKGQLLTVPTIPLETKLLKLLNISINLSSLKLDEKLKNKVKWYIKPIVFGGDSKIGQNMTWISMEDHIQAVKYWNGLYRDILNRQTT